MIGKFIRRASHKFGAAFAFQRESKTMRVGYHVKLRNTSNASQGVFLAIPYPTQASGQEILVEAALLPPNAEVKEEKIHKNKYIVWETTVPPRNDSSFSETLVLRTRSFELKSSPAMFHEYQNIPKRLMQPDAYIQCDDTKICDLAKKLKGNRKNVFKVARIFNDYIVKTLNYGNPIRGLYSAQDALQKDSVDCGGYNALFVALCRAVGIPARIVAGFWAGYRNNAMHAWSEFLLSDGTWVAVDPSTEQLFKQGRTKKFASFGRLGSDRIRFSTGSGIEIEVAGKKHVIDILQNPLVFPQGAREHVSVEHTITTEPV